MRQALIHAALLFITMMCSLCTSQTPFAVPLVDFFHYSDSPIGTVTMPPGYTSAELYATGGGSAGARGSWSGSTCNNGGGGGGSAAACHFKWINLKAGDVLIYNATIYGPASNSSGYNTTLYVNSGPLQSGKTRIFTIHLGGGKTPLGTTGGSGGDGDFIDSSDGYLQNFAGTPNVPYYDLANGTAVVGRRLDQTYTNGSKIVLWFDMYSGMGGYDGVSAPIPPDWMPMPVYEPIKYPGSGMSYLDVCGGGGGGANALWYSLSSGVYGLGGSSNYSTNFPAIGNWGSGGGGGSPPTMGTPPPMGTGGEPGIIIIYYP